MIFVPEGQADRSLARSAWDNATAKSRPVGYGVIRAGVRADSMIEVTKFQIRISMGNPDNLFEPLSRKTAAESSGVAGGFRCQSLHRSQISKDL